MRKEAPPAPLRRFWLLTLLSSAVASLMNACKTAPDLAEPVIAQ